jgi:hypothetical protein
MRSKKHLAKVVGDIIVSSPAPSPPSDIEVIVLDCPVEMVVAEKPMPVVADEERPKPLPKRRTRKPPALTKEQRWEKYNAEAMIDLDWRKQVWFHKMCYVLCDVRDFKALVV